MWAFSISLLFTFASKVRPLRTPTLWSQRSRWTTPWRWPAWSRACSCSPSSSWAWRSPSRGGECGLLPCRLCQPQVAPTRPYGQVLSLLTTSRQGPPGATVEVLKFGASCGSLCCCPKGVCWLRGKQLQDGQCLAGQVFLGVPMLLRDSCSVVIGHIIRITGELQGHRWAYRDRHRKAVFHSAHLHPSPICLWSRNSVPLHQRVEPLTGVTALREVSFLLPVPLNLPCWMAGACHLSAGYPQGTVMSYCAHCSWKPGSRFPPDPPNSFYADIVCLSGIHKVWGPPRELQREKGNMHQGRWVSISSHCPWSAELAGSSK